MDETCRTCVKRGTRPNGENLAILDAAAKKQEQQDCPAASFKCVNISADGGIRALADMELDVVAALIAPCMLPAAEQAAQNQNL